MSTSAFVPLRPPVVLNRARRLGRLVNVPLGRLKDQDVPQALGDEFIDGSEGRLLRVLRQG